MAATAYKRVCRRISALFLPGPLPALETASLPRRMRAFCTSFLVAGDAAIAKEAAEMEFGITATYLKAALIVRVFNTLNYRMLAASRISPPAKRIQT